MTPVTRLLASASVFAIIVAPVLPNPIVSDLGAAWAKDGGGGGGGNGGGGNGNGGGNGGGHGGAAASGRSESAASGRGGVAVSRGMAARGRETARSTETRGRGTNRGVSARVIGKHPDHAAIASKLGALNAAHASPTARAHAAPNSRVGMIAAYENAMLAALAMPATTPEQRALRDGAIAQARAKELNAAANHTVTPDVVSQVDNLLGVPATDPTLGTNVSP